MRIVTSMSPVVLGTLLCMGVGVGACATPDAENEANDDPTMGTSEETGDGDGDVPGDGDGDVPGDGDGDDSTGGACQLWVEDDCASESLKCMPYSAQDDGIPDSTRCCAVHGSPVSLGDRCDVFEYDGSCLDNCPVNTMCVIDQKDALEGYCQVYCDISNPNSCGPTEVCKPFFELIESAETIPLCMARCDPLSQDCAAKGRPGWSCLPEGALSPSFLCMPPSASPKQEYEGCLLANQCAVGLACVPASEVLGCEGQFNCCTQFCDLEDPTTNCSMGNECFDLESDVPGLENVGVCADPV